jgi:hypothetical protein
MAARRDYNVSIKNDASPLVLIIFERELKLICTTWDDSKEGFLSPLYYYYLLLLFLLLLLLLFINKIKIQKTTKQHINKTPLKAVAVEL